MRLVTDAWGSFLTTIKGLVTFLPGTTAGLTSTALSVTVLGGVLPGATIALSAFWAKMKAAAAETAFFGTTVKSALGLLSRGTFLGGEKAKRKGAKRACKRLKAVFGVGSIKPLTLRKRGKGAVKKPVITPFTGCQKVLNIYIPPLRFYFSVVLGGWFWYNVSNFLVRLLPIR